MTELGIVIGLYLLWDLIPQRARRPVMLYFWSVVLIVGVLGAIYSLWTTGSLPSWHSSPVDQWGD